MLASHALVTSVPKIAISKLRWESIPWGLEGILEYIKQSYILENGKQMKHGPMLEDTSRVQYMKGYIGAMLNAIKNGSDTRESMIDLYEILSGYMYSYGMYYVNFSDPGRKRFPKLSASWYSGFFNCTIDVTCPDITMLQSNTSGSSSL